MSLDQLYTLYDEIDIENTYVIASTENFWNQASAQDKYKAYICAYVHYNRHVQTASFASFVNKIKNKLTSVSNDNEYGQAHQNLTIDNTIQINNIVNEVTTGEKSWLQGLQELYSLNDLAVYGW